MFWRLLNVKCLTRSISSALGVVVMAICLLWALPVAAGINQWADIGPYGDQVQTLVIDPTNPEVLYAGTWSNGAYKSINSGSTWSNVNVGLTTNPITFFVVDPLNASILYAGSFASSGCFYKSTNGGASWSISNSGLESVTVQTVAFDPKNTATLYAGGSGGVYKSTDSGRSWIQIKPSPSIVTIVVDPVNPTTLYAGSYGAGIFKSSDGGNSWSQINNGLVNTTVVALIINPVTPATLYAKINGGTLYKSSDGGSSWVQIMDGMANAGFLALAVDPVKQNNLVAALVGGMVIKSEDAGTSWQQISTNPTIDVITSLAMTKSAQPILYAGLSGTGVMKSIDGGVSWNISNRGLTPLSIRQVATNASNPAVVFAGGFGGRLFRSSDSGINWEQQNSSQVNAMVADPSMPTTIYVATDGSGVTKSVNGGNSWTTMNNGLTNLLAKSLAIGTTSPQALYVGTDGSGVYKSVDGGNSWSPVNNGISTTTVQALVVDTSDSSIVYAGMNGGGVYKSVNGGATWSQMNTGLYSTFVQALTIDPQQPSILYAGTSGEGVFKSTNGGLSWKQIMFSNMSQNVRSVVLDPSNPAIVYAGTRDGVFMSINRGMNWYNINTGLKSNNVYAVAVSTSTPSTLYAGTYGGGVNAIQALTTTASPHGGIYTAPQNVILASNTAATIFYTIDGTDPVSSPTRREYIAQVPIDKNTVLKFYAVDPNGNIEPVRTETYTFSAITGRITDRTSGLGLPLVYVTAYNAVTGASIKTVQTDYSGYYSFEGLSSGTYKLYFCKDGYIWQWSGAKSDQASALQITVSLPNATTGVDVALIKYGGISGRITAAATGEGLLGAQIEIHDSVSGTQVASAMVDSNGNYSVSGLLNKSYKVTCRALGYTQRWYGDKSEIATAAEVLVFPPAITTGIDIALKKTGTISGRVTDSISGVGVQGVSVNIFESLTGNYTYKSTITDSSGVYILSDVDEGRYKASFTNNFYINQWFANKPDILTATEVTVLSGATTEHIDIAAVRKGVVSGRVTDKVTGQGLANMVVAFCQRPGGTVVCNNFVYSGSDGAFSVAWLTEGAYKVSFSGNNYSKQWYSNQADYESAVAVNITNGVTVTGIDASMVKGGSISGRIIDKATSNGIPFSAASVYRSDSNVLLTTGYADGSGNFTINGLSSGQYKLVFSTAEYVTQWYDNSPDWAHANPLMVTEATTTPGVNAALVKKGAISGKVIDSVTGVGIQNATFQINDVVTGQQPGYGGIDSTGAYTVQRLTTGDYKLLFRAPGYIDQWYNGSSNEATANVIKVTAPDTTNGIDFKLVKGATISGRVTDAVTGAGVSFVGIDAFDTVSGITRYNYWHTDTDGNYSVTGLPSGSYKLKFSGTGYAYTWYDGVQDKTHAKALTVTAPQTISGINVALSKSGAISGWVTDSLTGASIQGVLVEVVSAGTGDWIGSGITDSAGSYNIQGLSTGSYKVKYSADAYIGQWSGGKADYASAAVVTVSAPATTYNVITLTKGGSISGMVIDRDAGTGITGISVSLYSMGSNTYVGSGLTDSTGHYKINGLVSGNYKLLFDNSSLTSYQRQWYGNSELIDTASIVTLTATDSVNGIDIALKVGATITGTVADAVARTNISGGVVTLYEVATDTAQNSTNTDNAGNYRFAGLKSGNYQLAFNAPEYIRQWHNGKNNKSTATPVVLTVGDTISINAVLTKGGGSISGSVSIDAGCSGQRPWISVYDGVSGGLVREAMIIDGKYSVIGLPDGTYKVLVTNSQVNNWYRASGESALFTPLEVRVDSHLSDINLVFACSVTGVCGSANGATLNAAPMTNLCVAGTTSMVTGSGPWSWTCAGTNGGASANCSANVAPQQDGTSISWQQTGGPGGGDISVVAVAPSNSQIIYAGTTRGNIFKSSDGGATWLTVAVLMTSNDQLIPINSIAVDPVDSSIAYALTPFGIYRTTNISFYWQNITQQLVNFTSMVLDPSNSRVIYAGTMDNGIYKSTDAGNTWTQVNIGLGAAYLNVQSLVADPVNSQILYAGTGNGAVIKTSDGGASWNVMATGLTGTFVTALAVDPNNGTILYAGDSDGVFKSEDGGTSWRAVNTGLPGSALIRNIMPDRSDSQTVYVGTYASGIYKSRDGGASWSQLNHGLAVPSDASYVTLDTGNSQTLYACGKGIYKSEGSVVAWHKTDYGARGTIVDRLAVDPLHPQTVYAVTRSSNEQIYVSSNGGDSWSILTNGLPSNAVVREVVIDPTNSSTIYAGTHSNGLYKTTDGGANWSPIITNQPLSYVPTLVMDPKNSQTLYAGTFGAVYKTTDGGSSWYSVSSGLPMKSVIGLAIDPNDSQTIYAGTYTSGDIYKSSNGGGSWSLLTTIPNSSEGFKSFAIDPGNSAVIYAGGWYSGIYKSTDSGATWNAAMNGLPTRVVSGLLIDPGNSQTIYAATGSGVYRSSDGGASWNSVSVGLTSETVFSLVMVPGNNQVMYAGTYGAGVFKTGTYKISGKVTQNGSGVVGVTFSGATCTTTDSFGVYSCTVAPGWSGTITPSLSGYTFTPVSHSFSNVTADQTAQDFEASAINQNLTVVKAGSGTGTITPSTGSLVWNGNGGVATYINNAIVVLSASADAGSFLASWTGCDSMSGNQCTVAMSNTRLVNATFSLSPVNGACGSANGATLTAAPSANLCNSGTASTVSGSGPWGWRCDGLNGSTSDYCIAEIQSYLITFVSGGNGGIIGSASQTVNHGGSSSAVNVMPVPGYHFTGWSGSNGFSSSANPLTISAVTAPQTITASFAPDPVNGACGIAANHTHFTIPTVDLCAIGTASTVSGSGPWSWSCAGLNGGSSASCNAVMQPFYIAFVSGANGSISGSTNQAINNGGSTTAVSAVPAAGYHFVGWSGSNGFSSSANPLTISSVTMSQTITAVFAPDPANAACGSAHRTTVSTMPTNLCLTGTPSVVSGNGPWSWTCSGISGGSNSSCMAIPPLSGVLDPSSGKTGPDIADALRLLNIAVGKLAPSAADYAQGDIAPLDSNGRPQGNGVIDIYDVIGILRMAVGLM